MKTSHLITLFLLFEATAFEARGGRVSTFHGSSDTSSTEGMWNYDPTMSLAVEPEISKEPSPPQSSTIAKPVGIPVI